MSQYTFVLQWSNISDILRIAQKGDNADELVILVTFHEYN